jgi:lysyl-tRNA synthetase class 2
MFGNTYIQQRIEKAEALRKRGINPYAHNITRELSTKEFKEKFSYVTDRDETKEVTVSGRIKFLRVMGKASFVKIEDESGLLQIYVAKDNLSEGFYNEVFKKLIEVGDIIVVRGYPFVTKTGELSLHITDLKLATKGIFPLPEKFHRLTDKELRYRKRYLDMIMNPEVKETFLIRSKIVSLIRKFLEERGFLEVETPMLQDLNGGATAKPFITRHNALGVDKYLRIAPELNLKRLIVGGFEAVFEINRNFRNEGLDHTHNPEFTSLEFYWAYHNYEDLMELTEKLFSYLLKELELPTKLPFGEFEVDYSAPFKRITWKDALIDIGKIPKDIVDNREKITEYLKKKGIKVDKNLILGKLQDELFGEFVEPKLINPTFVTQYPVDISPLARRNDENPSLTDRFELFIAGREIANAFNELNDPIDQYERFTEQLKAKEAGDDEASDMDEDFVEALGYGMPPTAGEGIGIDRLVMLLTNQHSIKDVILFPAMKPIKKDEKQ